MPERTNSDLAQDVLRREIRSAIVDGLQSTTDGGSLQPLEDALFERLTDPVKQLLMWSLMQLAVDRLSPAAVARVEEMRRAQSPAPQPPPVGAARDDRRGV